MNKQDLIDSVAADTGRPKTMIEDILNAALHHIMQAVADGEKVGLVGFGTLQKVTRSERPGRNPRTGEPVIIPACDIPRFSPGKKFKDMVSGDIQDDEDDEAA